MSDAPQDLYQEVDPQPVRTPAKPVSAPRIPAGPLPVSESVPAGQRHWLWIGGVVVIIIAVGFGVYLWQGRESAAPTVTGNTNTSVNSSVNAAVQNAATTVPETQDIADKDKDGLTDAEEQTLGTNENAADTDQDGLADREEVQTYKTDPRKPDTDGDGSADGTEVENGYNPKGAGKLLDFEAARSKLTNSSS